MTDPWAVYETATHCSNCLEEAEPDDRFCRTCRAETVAECECGAHYDQRSYDELPVRGQCDCGRLVPIGATIESQTR